MIEPTTADHTLEHVNSLIRDTGASLAAIADAARVNRKTIERIVNGGHLVSATTQAKVLEVTPGDLTAVPEIEPDPDILKTLLSGNRALIPWGQKAIYHRALHQQGWSNERIATVTRSSFEMVRNSLLVGDIAAVRAESERWRDAHDAAVRRKRAWQDYAHRVEAKLSRIAELAERLHLMPVLAVLRGSAKEG